MAEKKPSSIRSVSRKLSNLDTTMDNLYQSTYSTRLDNKNDMNRILTGIEDNLDDLLSTVNGQNISDITSLIMRIQSKNGDNKYIKDLRTSVQDMVQNNQYLDNLAFENIQKHIQTEDYQYDLILKYLPKLGEALDIMKDNVLSSDNFTKDFINVIANKSGEDFLNTFNSRAKKLKEKYKVQDLFEEMYQETARYGEYFLYHVPYKKAFERLLTRKQASIKVESVDSDIIYNNRVTDTVLFESTNMRTFNEAAGVTNSAFINTLEGTSVNLTVDPYGIISEYIEEIQQAANITNKYTSLTEEYLAEAEGYDIGTDKTLKYDPINMTHDGFIHSANGGEDIEKIKIKPSSGSVIHKIPRDEVLPLYIGNNFCLGYIKFKFITRYQSTNTIIGNTYNSLVSTGKITDTELDKQKELFIGKLASDISDVINSKFINANLDLKDEIYAILRYNDEFNLVNSTNNINMSFIPAEDIHHFYFQLDPKTHRGISDLKKSLVPAMMYIMLYLTDIISKTSRSQDHRVYYVKQNVETNVARTMLNVITQIKKGNMSMRQLENLNTIFNVIGKYNDFVVPVGQSGDSPIDFQILQGEQTETPTDLMDRMVEEAINSTDVPYEFVQSVNQVDFATRFTMSNSKFLRKVFKRQRICQDHYTDIFRKLYNYEYAENETSMQIQLPAPAFLTMTNSQQLFDNTKQFVQAIVDTELADDEELKPIAMRNLIRNFLGTYIDYDTVDNVIACSRQELELNAVKKAANDDLSGLEADNF